MTANKSLMQLQDLFITAILVSAIGLANTNVAWAQAETLPRNKGIVSVVYVRSDTETRFDFLGDRVRVIPPAGSEFRGSTTTDIISTDVAFGITNPLEAHINIPFARVQGESIGADGRVIKNPAQSPSEVGLSNVRFGVRYNIVSEPFVLTAKFDIKTPASAADVEKAFNGTALPVQEGQVDFDLTGQASKRVLLFNRSFRLDGEAGVRFRRTQKDGALDTFTGETLPISPAKEFIYNFRITYAITRRLSLTLAGDGIEQGDFKVPFRFIRVGENGDLKTVGTQGSIPPGFNSDFEEQTGRRIFSLGPVASVAVTGRTTIFGGLLFTVSGRNYPAGQFLVLGVSRAF